MPEIHRLFRKICFDCISGIRSRCSPRNPIQPYRFFSDREEVLQFGLELRVEMLAYRPESAARDQVRVNPEHTGTDCLVCGHRQKTPLKVGAFACEDCGVVMDRDANACRKVFQRGIVLAEWEIEPKVPHGMSGNVHEGYARDLSRQDAEQYAELAVG